jgi:hypothetical protein
MTIDEFIMLGSARHSMQNRNQPQRLEPNAGRRARHTPIGSRAGNRRLDLTF